MLPILERNYVPDFLIRYCARMEIAMELAKLKALKSEDEIKNKIEFVKELKTMPIAIQTKKANDQHYEVPDEFYRLSLGSYMKYSSGYWPSAKTTLEESEIAMLELYCERAGIVDGMKLIDLGCGWGSVTIYMANKYRNCTIVSISNSNSQREYIYSKAQSMGLDNITVYTGDINNFDLPKELYNTADRVISIEMFEHMKNYQLLMAKVSNWIKPGGKLFIHIFTHKDIPGHYSEGWMTDNFFTGGTLPSDDLLLYFQDYLKIESQWRVNGKHYQKTLEAWLRKMDNNKDTVMPVLAKAYGKKDALKWYVNWRLFYIGCAEFFGFKDGFSLTHSYLLTHSLTHSFTYLLTHSLTHSLRGRVSSQSLPFR